jgi:hypothetical protein
MPPVESQVIERHKYDSMIVSMRVELYVNCRCGFRVIEKIMACLNDRLAWNLEEPPSYTSIKNWVEKSGYYTYGHPQLKSSDISYGAIIDESMQIGSEKLLLCMGMKATKENEAALKMTEVEILDISVEKSWNGSLISGKLKGISAAMKKSPAYVISDNASIMNKGSFTHIRDVGHTLAMFPERQYKHAPDFLSLMKGLAKVKNREIMRPVAYLLPPKQRIIARFMNLTPCLDWAMKMLRCLNKLSKEEQQIFDFLKTHKSLIVELNGIIYVFNQISQILKEKGLSYKNIRISIQQLQPFVDSPLPRISQAVKECLNYLREEASKLETGKSLWHLSSDILESIFWVYKDRKSPNALNGVNTLCFNVTCFNKIKSKIGFHSNRF